MMSPVRFASASLAIDQSGLDYFADQSKRYMNYKADFNTLSRLGTNAGEKLAGMSDHTRIRLHSMSFYRQDAYTRSREYHRMQLRATVTTHDTERDKDISRTLKRRRLEPVRAFWRRVLSTAQKMDRVLAPKTPGDGKKGHYTFDKERP